MSHPDETPDGAAYDEAELRLFAQLAREAPVSPRDADVVVQRLRHEGLLRQRASSWRWAGLAAATVLLFAAGAFIGRSTAQRGSLEDMLTRRDLTLDERVLLLQRAGSAYVQAAQAYANATAGVDSTAVEVASRVLLGAANAVARSSLDAGLSSRLAAVLQPSTTAQPPMSRRPVIWF